MTLTETRPALVTFTTFVPYALAFEPRVLRTVIFSVSVPGSPTVSATWRDLPVFVVLASLEASVTGGGGAVVVVVTGFVAVVVVTGGGGGAVVVPVVIVVTVVTVVSVALLRLAVASVARAT